MVVRHGGGEAAAEACAYALPPPPPLPTIRPPAPLRAARPPHIAARSTTRPVPRDQPPRLQLTEPKQNTRSLKEQQHNNQSETKYNKELKVQNNSEGAFYDGPASLYKLFVKLRNFAILIFEC